jgi:hypothetical protein
MRETLFEPTIEPVSEEVKRELARQALRDTVPPYNDDTYAMLVEL